MENVNQYQFDKVTFGPRLQTMRKNKGYTQADMLEPLGLTRRATYAAWESPTQVNAMPNLPQLLKLCAMFETQPLYLMCGLFGEQEEQIHVDAYMQIYTRYKNDPEFYFLVTAMSQFSPELLRAVSRLMEEIYEEAKRTR